MRYNPAESEPVAPTPDSLDKRADELREEMVEAAHLCIYLVNGEQIEEARKQAVEYFAALADWRVNREHRQSLHQSGGCA